MFGPITLRPDTDPEVVLQGKMRPERPAGGVVTIFFVNTQPEQERKKDQGLGVPAEGA